MGEMHIARKRPDGTTQSIDEHSGNVAEIMAAASRYPSISKLIAYLHDLGKLSPAFQDYIKNGGVRGSVIHAWQGAFLTDELFPGTDAPARLLKEIIGFCVTAHHSHLQDGISPDGRTDYFDKFAHTADPKYFYSEVKEKLTENEKSALQNLFEDAKSEINGLLTQIKASYHTHASSNFAMGLFVKYLFSLLVDADRLDAYCFETGERLPCPRFDWDPVIEVFERSIAAFPSATPMDRIRQSVSEECKNAAGSEPGIYQLSVPTGGGKTLSSFRFALHHCKAHGKKRIIYVIPYLSIIEQTAQTLRDSLHLAEENDVIFEHHSDLMEPEDESAAQIRAMAAARWDSPIIITTMVQFMESVMSSKSGKLRKFASMADAVIIFDEIQAMPLKLIHCFNEIVSFLSALCGTTVLLCSATQPTLEATQRANLRLHPKVKLIDCAEAFRGIKRVQAVVEKDMDCQSASDFIVEKAQENGDCLVIVNTKKAALKLYCLLKCKAAEFEVLHLSTSMCPRHRNSTLRRLRDSLAARKKVICIATQLIEAGVDISFNCVVRAMAGLDSVAQAAGRGNRHGQSSSPKNIYIFTLTDENLDRLPDIKSGQEITQWMTQRKNNDTDLLSEENMAEFYRLYFAGKSGQMDYPVNGNAYIYDMLSKHEEGRKNCTKKDFSPYIPQAFYAADQSFSVIEQNTKAVVVLWGEAQNLVDEYRRQPAGILTKEKIRLLKKLQSYSVALYDWEICKLSEQYALDLLDEETGILLLAANYYSEETGVVLTSVQDVLIVDEEG